MEEQVKKDEELARKLQQEECEAAGDIGKAVADSINNDKRKHSVSFNPSISTEIIDKSKEKKSPQNTEVTKRTSSLKKSVKSANSNTPIIKTSRKSINIFYNKFQIK